jgi:hypothetical protein
MAVSRTGLIIAAVLTSLCIHLSARATAQDETDLESTVIFVTLDGLRWQELFRGADERLMNQEWGNVDNPDSLTQRFWRDDVQSRREVLLPFVWGTIARQGQILGDPRRQCEVRVTNDQHFSYPGYNEILCGFADPKITSNAKQYNQNVTVLEWLHRKPGFAGRVFAFTSWDVFPFIINTRRSGLPVNAGWQQLDGMADAAQQQILNDLANELPRYWSSVRYDAFTFRGALDCLEHRKPRVLYVALGETDDWAHAGRYDLYLHSAQQSDDYIRRLWEVAQKNPRTRGRTTLIITTDHGRGNGREDWKSHSTSIPGCDRIWFAALGPGVPPLGIRESLRCTQSQAAATVAAAVGEDFTAFDPRVADPLRFVTTAATK